MDREYKVCDFCRRSLDINQFYYSHDLERHPDGKLNICKDCLRFNTYDPASFIPVLQEIDVPYLQEDWNKLVVKWNGQSKAVLGRYLAKMKLFSFKDYRYKDTTRLQKWALEYKERERKRAL